MMLLQQWPLWVTRTKQLLPGTVAKEQTAAAPLKHLMELERLFRPLQRHCQWQQSWKPKILLLLGAAALLQAKAHSQRRSLLAIRAHGAEE